MKNDSTIQRVVHAEPKRRGLTRSSMLPHCVSIDLFRPSPWHGHSVGIRTVLSSPRTMTIEEDISDFKRHLD